MNPKFLISSLALITGLLVGWLLVGTSPEEDIIVEEKKVMKQTIEPVAPNPQSDRKATQASNRDRDFDPNAIPYERIIAFSNEEDYRRFLEKLANSKLRNLGQIDALRAIRIGFDNLHDFDALDLDPDQLSFNYPVTIPEQREIPPQSGLVGFGNSALEFLGITADNSEWGKGVKVAVIDTGIVPHLALTGKIQHINLVDLPAGVEPNSHGTSVASLIAGSHPNMRGVVPAVDLISVRVADETGYSTSFLLAEGIIAAADAGADYINISLGSEGDSSLVRQAVGYATERGVVIFASSGNSGSDNAAFPAGDERVFSVGGVDALGQHLNFSSKDPDLDFVAPSYEVRVAMPGDRITSMTGTSAGTPLALGSAVSIETESETYITSHNAAVTLGDYSNEAGPAGSDERYGQGIIDPGRAHRRNTPDIVDLAVAAQNYTIPDENTSGSGSLQVSIENRGTTTVHQSTVSVNIGGDIYSVPIQALRSNELRVVTIPAGLGQLRREGELSIRSEVTLGNGANDLFPNNDQRTDVILYPSDEN